MSRRPWTGSASRPPGRPVQPPPRAGSIAKHPRRQYQGLPCRAKETGGTSSGNQDRNRNFCPGIIGNSGPSCTEFPPSQPRQTYGEENPLIRNPGTLPALLGNPRGLESNSPNSLPKRSFPRRSRAVSLTRHKALSHEFISSNPLFLLGALLRRSFNPSAFRM